MPELVPPSCYLELVKKLQKWIFRTAGSSLAVSLETLGHCRNIATIGITLVGIHLNWLNWFHFLILKGGLILVLF